MAKKKKDNNPAGLLIPAGVLTGIGVGFLLDDVAAWTMIGLGAGFVAMFIAMAVMKKK
ncbi:hypothetical protein KY316_03705 [Candidatus Woesearchaeota archaeon]|nr:hypothetical protein [Candidatus Woesearchaeota archaeon]